MLRQGASCALALLAASGWGGPASVVAGPFPPPSRLAKDVYALIGVPEAPSRNNRAHVANQAFIIGSDGVVVIDTGSSARFGEHLVRSIRERTSRPIVLVILTRPLDDAIFGATVLQAEGASVLAHEDAARLIAERCETCLKNLVVALGEPLLRDTRVPRPDRLFKGSRTITAGGRTLELIDHTGAAAPGSIAVWDPASGILFAGGLASFRRIPETRDGSVTAWRSALRELVRIAPRRVLPAHGPPGGPSDLLAVAGYLQRLEDRTAEAYGAQVSLLDAPARVEVGEFSDWALYPEVHRRNVHYRYLAHERSDLARP